MHQSRSGRAFSRVTGFLSCWLLAAGAGSSAAFAEFSLLRPEKDSTLIESPTGALANGSGPAIFAGRTSSGSGSIRRTLVAFDLLSAIPQGSTVTNAVLSLNLSATNAGPVPVRLHRVLADWGEGPSVSSGGGGVPSDPGDSTWIHRFYSEVFWAHPGGDFDPAARAVSVVDQPGLYSWGSTSEMVADVQSWLDHPETAYGWILLGDETLPTTVKRFDSREHAEEANRPLLYVEFIPPCSPDPAGPGYWKRQCSGLTVDGGAAGGEASDPAIREPRFAEWVVPCTDRIFDDLGLPEIRACDILGSNPPQDCRERATGKVSVLVLNVCAGRFQTSCPVASTDGDCASTNLGDLLRELALLIRRGDCRRASGCAGILD